MNSRDSFRNQFFLESSAVRNLQSMSKPGRNDPCHCGSGKKYKKCCADKDEQMARAQNGMSDLDKFLTALQDERGWEPGDEEYPSLPEPDQRLVDEWWNVYRKIDTIEEIRPHLDNFLNNHPHLVENLGLEHEVLFELGADYRRGNLTDEYIRFLLDFRKRFPVVYAKIAAYLDADVIGWLISQQRAGEIGDYLDYFIGDPVTNVDQLHSVIDLLLATDNTSELIPLIMQVVEVLADSDDVIQDDKIAHILLIDKLSSNIKENTTTQDIHTFISAAQKSLPDFMNRDEYLAEIWFLKMQAITRPFVSWGDVKNLEQQELRKLYANATMNFLRYLREMHNTSWMCALYYADLVSDLMQEYLSGKNKVKHIFRLSMSEMDALMSRMSADIGPYIDCAKLMSLLNGLYYFAAYLHHCGDLSDENTNTMQAQCKEFFKKFYPPLAKDYAEAACFARFPLFGAVES
jgi:hypothetical protein